MVPCSQPVKDGVKSYPDSDPDYPIECVVNAARSLKEPTPERVPVC
jgi:hypothetical protein